MFNFGKSNKVANLIDSEVNTAKTVVQNAVTTAKHEFDLVEEQLGKLAQLANGEPMFVMMLDNLKSQINTSQAKIVQNLNSIDATLTKIDQHTNLIQN